MSRTFGWVQNPNRLEKLKYITGVMLKGSYSNTEMLETWLKGEAESETDGKE